jgi:hypothetical protein
MVTEKLPRKINKGRIASALAKSPFSLLSTAKSN